MPSDPNLYQQLRALIENGDVKIGDLLPTEDQLCEEYKVSRYALRQALGNLEREGFIQRRRRAGTKVIAQEAKDVYRYALGSRNDLLSFVSGTSVTFAPPRVIVTDRNLARLLGCDELRRWNVLDGIRVDATTKLPIGVTQVYIDASRVNVSSGINLEGHAVYEWIERNYRIRAAGVSQDIGAVLLAPEEAEALGERAGLPALKIIRRYFDDQQRIYMIAVTTHRSEDFVYNMRFQFDQ